MSIPKTKRVSFHLWMTEDQNAKLEIMAKVCKKNKTQYILDNIFEVNIDTTKTDLYNTLDIDLGYLKRSVYVLTKLCMALMNFQFKDPDMIKKFTSEAMEEAEMYFSKKS